MAEGKENFFSNKSGQKSKRGCLKWFGSCFLITLILFVALAIYIASAIAASGLAEVPILSRIFFRQIPVPNRVVEPASSNALTKALENQIQAGKSDFITLELSENEITGLLDNLTKKPNPTIEKAQGAIDSDGLELFLKTGKFDSPLSDLYFTVSILPKISDDQLDFEIKKFKIGHLSIPAALTNLGKNFTLNNLKKSPTYKELNLTEIRIESNKVIITGRPNLEKLLPKE